jgi:hypothetical protein
LEVQLEKAKPRKRRKVRTSPNSKFADISNIQQAQLEVGEAINVAEDEDKSNESESTLDYILIE